MCVMSMVVDHYHDKWKEKIDKQEWDRVTQPVLPILPVTPEEIEDFRKLLERAREYDRKNNQADCEMEDKKRLLKELAAKLGVNIDFIEAKQ